MRFRLRRIASNKFILRCLLLSSTIIFVFRVYEHEKRELLYDFKLGGYRDTSKSLLYNGQQLDENRTVSEIFKRRQLTQQRECANFEEKGMSDEKNFRAHVQFVPEHKMLYCGIEKVGSTFWRRTIQLLNQGIVKSPYSIKPQDAMKNYKSFDETGIDDYTSILKNNKKFLFVRDPYSRLVSGYADKLFSPNPFYWSLIGVNAVKFNRKSKEKTCGHDLTFEEFIKFFIYTEEQNRHRDGHFLPATDHCRPCLVKYDYIGKMESFKRDVKYILEQFTLQNYTNYLDNFKEDSVNDAIYDTAQAHTSMYNQFIKCTSATNGLKRIWRKLQIRGIIANEIGFPKEFQRMSKLPQKTMMKVLKAAHTKSLQYNLVHQKKMYLIQAYNNLPIATMRKLQHIFYNDFRIFGYDPEPAHLFQSRESFKTINIFAVYMPLIILTDPSPLEHPFLPPGVLIDCIENK